MLFLLPGFWVKRYKIFAPQRVVEKRHTLEQAAWSESVGEGKDAGINMRWIRFDGESVFYDARVNGS